MHSAGKQDGAKTKFFALDFGQWHEIGSKHPIIEKAINQNEWRTVHDMDFFFVDWNKPL
jgi:hypothetical protein